MARAASTFHRHDQVVFVNNPAKKGIITHVNTKSGEVKVKTRKPNGQEEQVICQSTDLVHKARYGKQEFSVVDALLDEAEKAMADVVDEQPTRTGSGISALLDEAEALGVSTSAEEELSPEQRIMNDARRCAKETAELMASLTKTQEENKKLLGTVSHTFDRWDDLKDRFEKALQGTLNQIAIGLQNEAGHGGSRGARRVDGAGKKPGRKFVTPTKAHTTAALGSDLARLPKQQRAAFDLECSCFEREIPKVPGAWLEEHEERGQSFKAFCERAVRVEPTMAQDTLHLVPIGDFKGAQSPSMKALETFCNAFFGCQVETLPPIKRQEVETRARNLDMGYGAQLHCHELREKLVAMKKPKTSFCAVGVTLHDLYTSKDGRDWNFVFGQASLNEGVGVFSFARYRAEAHMEPTAAAQRMLLRSTKVLAHETCHILGMKHCIYYNCLMNGSNHTAEADSKPCELCPICLRKLLHATGGDAVKRYHALHSWYRENGFRKQCMWLEERLRYMGAEPPAQQLVVKAATTADQINQVYHVAVNDLCQPCRELA